MGFCTAYVMLPICLFFYFLVLALAQVLVRKIKYLDLAASDDCLQNGCPVDSSPSFRENLLEEAVNNMTSTHVSEALPRKELVLTVYASTFFFLLFCS